MTGASRGIGRTFALRTGRARVCLSDIEGRGATIATEEMRVEDLQVTPAKLDVTDRAEGYEGQIDTTLTPAGTQYGATLSNPQQRKSPGNAGFATPCKPLQRLTDHSYLEQGQAVRVRSSALYFACKSCKNEKLPMLVSAALSAVR